MCVRQDSILQDWNNVKKAGYGQGKQKSMNERIAQWKVSGEKFEGGVYQSIYEGQDYQDKGEKLDLLTWNCLCAKHGAEANKLCVCVCNVGFRSGIELFNSLV